MIKDIFKIPIFIVYSSAFAQNINLGNGVSAVIIETKEYGTFLNQTREKAGAFRVERKKELDQYCYQRCLRLARIFIENPDAYLLDFENDKSIFHKQAHQGFTKTENAYNRLGFMYDYDSISNDYDRSPGHYKVRVNQKWKYFGTSTIVISFVGVNIDYDPENPTSRKIMPQKLTISYEAFD